MDNHGRLAQTYESEGRARHVPEQAVSQGLSRSLADSPVRVQAWIYAGEADQRASPIKMRSVVQVYLSHYADSHVKPMGRQACGLWWMPEHCRVPDRQGVWHSPGSFRQLVNDMSCRQELMRRADHSVACGV